MMQLYDNGIHMSVGKTGPFTLENHIHVKALKLQGFPAN